MVKRRKRNTSTKARRSSFLVSTSSASLNSQTSPARRRKVGRRRRSPTLGRVLPPLLAAKQYSGSEDSLQLARDAALLVENGWPLSSAAIKIWKISRTELSPSAISRAYHRHVKRDKRHGGHLLSQEQEDVLVFAALALDAHNFALESRWVREICEGSFGVKVSDRWARRFLQSERVFHSRRLGRSQESVPMRVCMRKQKFGLRNGRNGLILTGSRPAHCVVNVDETRVVFKDEYLYLKRLTKKKTDGKRSNVRFSRTHDVASLVPFVNAAGDVILFVLVLKASFDESDASKTVKFELQKSAYEFRGTVPMYYAWTSSGYLDASCFSSVMDAFVLEWKKKLETGWVFICVSSSVFLFDTFFPQILPLPVQVL